MNLSKEDLRRRYEAVQPSCLYPITFWYKSSYIETPDLCPDLDGLPDDVARIVKEVARRVLMDDGITYRLDVDKSMESLYYSIVYYMRSSILERKTFPKQEVCEKALSWLMNHERWEFALALRPYIMGDKKDVYVPALQALIEKEGIEV